MSPSSGNLRCLDKKEYLVKHIPEEDLARINELAEEFNVPVYIVRSMYDVMLNELYDGIVVALEDMEAEGLLEDL